jgi:hypothetical protein
MMVKIVTHELLYDPRNSNCWPHPLTLFRAPEPFQDPLFIINIQWYRRLTALRYQDALPSWDIPKSLTGQFLVTTVVPSPS